MGVHSCPDCNGMVSDLAKACPHCGSPVVIKSESTGAAPSAQPKADTVDKSAQSSGPSDFTRTSGPSGAVSNDSGLMALLNPRDVPPGVSAMLRLLYLSMIPLGVALLSFPAERASVGYLSGAFEGFAIVLLVWAPLILAYHGALGALLGKGFVWARIVGIASAATILTVVGLWSIVQSFELLEYVDHFSWLFEDSRMTIQVLFSIVRILGFAGWAVVHLVFALRLRSLDVRAFFKAESSPI